METLLEINSVNTLLPSENILEPLLVGELLRQEGNKPKYRFFIPSYQRGYRWNESQVIDLLEDLLEFITTTRNNDQKYCLQPIVVKKMVDAKYEVLDGQQRLTTILILLSRLKSKINDIELFSIEYETRPDSAEFLKSNIVEINKDNPDYFYISKAYMTIDKWLTDTREIKANISTSLYNALVESIEFIWYEIINDHDAIDIFTRINIGKIPLTNSELVKAVFLSKNNLSIGYASSEIAEKDFNKILSLKQNAIALEWYQMEKVLQDPKVWGFIYNDSESFETRIDYLLDLSSHKSATEKNKYFSFKYFYDKVQKTRSDARLQEEFARNNTSFIEEEWNNLKSIFDILLEWYHDKIFNHLIGFLIDQDADIAELVDSFRINNRDKFLDIMKAKIKTLINCTDISKLRYKSSSDYKKLHRILLLHNVINSLKIDDNNVYFPFENMKNKSWTLEHIFAQNPDDLREEDYQSWLRDHFPFFIAKVQDVSASDITTRITKLLATNKKIDKDDFQECFGKVATYIQNEISKIDASLKSTIEIDESDAEHLTIEEEYTWINEDHSIANLALLDGSSNSALKNSLFDIKRTRILEKDKAGLFVPNETKKVFLKYYTAIPKHLAYWTFEDRKAYVNSIKSSLSFLN
ncbi:DUF262 domain-containing protein [Flavobacterium sp.]|uniref:DUF262 domain-containing protein n=1 Tax=Flavobacterium sp. TaxID=239 RepID=UPI00374CAF71